MSKIVDWEREDLFHLPMDEAPRFLHGLAGRRVQFRADYGLYEYTAYAYKSAINNQIVPVLRPQLPSAELVLKYMRRIDAARIYSNFGPLVLELERKMSNHLQLPVGTTTCASSGTSGLVRAILACAGRAKAERPWAVIPSYTF